MTLVVDIGNTRLKWARVNGSELVARGDAIYPKAGMSQVLEKCWSSLIRPYRVLVCNVAGPVIAEALSTWVMQRWGCPVEFVTARLAGWGVTNAYQDPASLGADRWATLIAAHRKFPPPVCVVDCGTAITIDVLAAEGLHLGGLILPGLTLMRRSLYQRTDALPEVASGNLSLLARNTNDGVATGTFYATVALVDRVIADTEAALETRVTCVVCGGDARLFAPYFIRRATCEPDLVLLGTAIMAEAPV
ncbi:MAG: type III pantothenate kinase [Gammaproteobacteria bacterium]|jgi:type III pantothenate kinase